MHDGFGLVNPVTATHLERIVRDERLGRDHPRRNSDERPKPANSAAGRNDEPPEPTSDLDSAASETHIDLRI